MMNKILIILGLLVINVSCVNAADLSVEQAIQQKISDIGTQLLNTNKIDKRVVFVYSDLDKQKILDVDKAIPSGQVIVYRNIYRAIEDDNELAAALAREIIVAVKSQKGVCGGTLTALQIKAAPKKYEIVGDKRAVDYMVKAGYNPVALITYINKTVPQKRHDFISNKNLASRRLAIIYEYIYTKYPYYLANNEYINNKHYQNFLLNSVSNRRLLEEKIQSGSTKKIHYE